LYKIKALQAPLASFSASPAKLAKIALFQPKSACASTFYCETIKNQSLQLFGGFGFFTVQGY